ncbi:MAG: nucleotidyltransferase domain-containing protein [Candidatus Uhrbacteria bacterium]
MDLKHFYKFSQKEIIKGFREFIETDMFSHYPFLKNKISLIITGSVPSGHYDEYSDIDTEFFYSNEKDREKINAVVREYKATLRERNIPVQFHPAKTFVELKKEHLTGWNNDDALREYSLALIVLDAGNRYQKIQSAIKWYPKDVLREKLQWLFAETIFNFEDRFTVAVKRRNNLYLHSVRSLIIKLLGNVLLMTGGHYPVYEKHLYTELKTFDEKSFCQKVDGLFIITDMVEMQKKLGDLILSVEKRLIKDGWIKKETKEYWMILRPKYRVEHCS